ncbi:hypothetical protein FY036_13050 [Mesorhizobium microcysteis]|uniref:EVE domain-containing protein n=1 Tax=Neoaquamicrobium microcysteis TaxID=2682781 RepID=A0A5D4GW31_9HYPH|nr:hypothetical protein [Mesorhizobium microcysteis]TYR32009.1 hypothetical protein FY036_13050 [Mesorhizobium microcysteis]
MKLYTFICKNKTNIWAGIGAGLWAVSDADPSIMKARRTRSYNIRPGNIGLIYCSDESSKSLTTPFIFVSAPDPEETEKDVWPEEWKMPFRIHPLGTPRKEWNAHEAAKALPFNTASQNTNVTSVFKAVGTAVFTPIEIGDEDWAMILDRLADKTSAGSK